MNLRRLMKIVLPALAVAGCEISTPFAGPGYDPGTGVSSVGGDTFVLSVTQAVVRDDAAARSVFWDCVDQVNESLKQSPGLVGYSRRTELFGPNAWTLTVWTDIASMNAFIDSEPHKTAMRTAFNSLVDAKFARTTIGRGDVPVSWERALEILDTEGRHFYE